MLVNSDFDVGYNKFDQIVYKILNCILYLFWILKEFTTNREIHKNYANEIFFQLKNKKPRYFAF